MKKLFAAIILTLLSLLTIASVCSACFWSSYQPELPQRNQ
jgi:cyclic lactone autoinducer peptide